MFNLVKSFLFLVYFGKTFPETPKKHGQSLPLPESSAPLEGACADSFSTKWCPGRSITAPKMRKRARFFGRISEDQDMDNLWLHKGRTFWRKKVWALQALVFFKTNFKVWQMGRWYICLYIAFVVIFLTCSYQIGVITCYPVIATGNWQHTSHVSIHRKVDKSHFKLESPVSSVSSSTSIRVATWRRIMIHPPGN